MQTRSEGTYGYVDYKLTVVFMLLESGKYNMYMASVCCSLSIPQVEKFGMPTWKRLVEAVGDKMGGNNPALALTIAKEHPGK